ncbi:MAG: stage III sporulation protein AB [Ruminococcus sp.]|nr:stage III sporulation protein AB [Ruminococcus sp.]
MFIKYTGILLVFITLCLLGRQKSVAAQRELDTIRSLYDKLVSCKLSLKFNKVRSSKIVADLRQICDRINDKEVNKLIADLCKSVGTTPLDGQLLLFEGCEERLKLKLNELEKKMPVKCKLYSSLGVLSGAFLAIILI